MYDVDDGAGGVVVEGRVRNYNIGFSLLETSIINFGDIGDMGYDVRVGDRRGRAVVSIVDMEDDERVILKGEYLHGCIQGDDEVGVFIRFKSKGKVYRVETSDALDIGVEIRVREEPQP